MDRSHYFDYAAATPLDAEVLEMMLPYMRDSFANPSATYTLAREQKQALEGARARVARIFGAKAAEVTFTSGSSDSIRLALTGLCRHIAPSNVVLSSIEHTTVLNTIKTDMPGWTTTHVEPEKSGKVNIGAIRGAITDDTSLVCMQYVNNETGVIQPVAALGKAVAIIRTQRLQRGITKPLYFICDAAQAGLQTLAVSRLSVYLLSMGGTKIYGPPGSGILYSRTGVPVFSDNNGTANVPAAVGFATAVEKLQHDRHVEMERLAGLRSSIWTKLNESIPDIRLNGDLRASSPQFLNVTIPGAPGETMVAHLDAAGFSVATGSACTAANQEPSHVLLGMGLSETDAESSLRISLGRHASAVSVNELSDAISQAAHRVRELAS